MSPETYHPACESGGVRREAVARRRRAETLRRRGRYRACGRAHSHVPAPTPAVAAAGTDATEGWVRTSAATRTQTPTGLSVSGRSETLARYPRVGWRAGKAGRVDEQAASFRTAFVRLAAVADGVPAADVAAADWQALQRVVSWAREFLCHPHATLGRDGDVCPYTRPSIDAGLFYLTVWRASGAAVGAELRAAMRAARRFWEELAPTSGPQVLFKTVLVVLPGLDDRPALIDAVQRELSLEFTRDGLMVGEFYPSCPVTGLHDQEFRPMQSPIPLLAIRRMVLGDLPFVCGVDAKLDSYFRLFGESARRMTERYLQRASRLPPEVVARLRRRLDDGEPAADQPALK